MLSSPQGMFDANISVMSSLGSDPLKKFSWPTLQLDNSLFFNANLILSPAVAYELFGEAFQMWSNKEERNNLPIQRHAVIDMGNHVGRAALLGLRQ